MLNAWPETAHGEIKWNLAATAAPALGPRPLAKKGLNTRRHLLPLNLMSPAERTCQDEESEKLPNAFSEWLVIVRSEICPQRLNLPARRNPLAGGGAEFEWATKQTLSGALSPAFSMLPTRRKKTTFFQTP